MYFSRKKKKKKETNRSEENVYSKHCAKTKLLNVVRNLACMFFEATSSLWNVNVSAGFQGQTLPVRTIHRIRNGGLDMLRTTIALEMSRSR